MMTHDGVGRSRTSEVSLVAVRYATQATKPLDAHQQELEEVGEICHGRIH